MLSSSPCSSCTRGVSSSLTEGWCASPSRCSFAFDFCWSCTRAIAARELSNKSFYIVLRARTRKNNIARHLLLSSFSAESCTRGCVVGTAEALLLSFLQKLAGQSARLRLHRCLKQWLLHRCYTQSLRGRCGGSGERNLCGI